MAKSGENFIINPDELSPDAFAYYRPNHYGAAVRERLRESAAEHGIARVLATAEDPTGQIAVERFVKVSAGIAELAMPDFDEDALLLAAQQYFALFAWDGPADKEAGYWVEESSLLDEDGQPATGRRFPEFYEIFDIAEDIFAYPERYAEFANPYATLLSNLTLKLRHKMSGEQFERWKTAYLGYLGGVELELYFRDRGKVPSLEEFGYMREETSAVGVVATLLEVQLGTELSDEEWMSKQVRLALNLINSRVTKDNEIMSFDIEKAEGRAELSLFTIMMDQLGCSMEDAYNQVMELREEHKDALEKLENQLQRPDANTRILRLVRGLRLWAHGYLRFVKEHPHYKPDLEEPT